MTMIIQYHDTTTTITKAMTCPCITWQNRKVSYDLATFLFTLHCKNLVNGQFPPLAY